MPRIWQPLPRLRPFVWLHLAFAAPDAGSLQRDPRWWAGHGLARHPQLRWRDCYGVAVPPALQEAKC